MFEFHCWSCGEKIRISPENLFNKISIQCHNCDNPMPTDAVKALRLLSESYMDIIDVLYKTNTHNRGWGVSICESKRVIPDNPDEFFYRQPSSEDSFWNSRKKPFKPTDNKELTSDDDLPY